MVGVTKPISAVPLYPLLLFFCLFVCFLFACLFVFSKLTNTGYLNTIKFIFDRCHLSSGDICGDMWQIWMWLKVSSLYIWLNQIKERSFSHPTHDDVIKWKNFQRNWPFVRGIRRQVTKHMLQKLCWSVLNAKSHHECGNFIWNSLILE